MYKPSNNQPNKIIKFILCIVLPYILFNGLILFLIIDKPEIIILNESTEEIQEIRFAIKHILPINNISVINNEEAVYYYKDGRDYIIPVETNGSYKISATTINNMTSNTYIEVTTNDDENPIINVEDAIYTAGTLTITVNDNDSGINYDKIYGTVGEEDVKPSFIDKATGTIKFKIEPKQTIVIHIEDQAGNTTESEIITD